VRRVHAAARPVARAEARADPAPPLSDPDVTAQPGPTAPATGPRTTGVTARADGAAVPISPPARTPGPVSTLPDDRYLNRELSWLDFNARVLALAEDPSQPLLERAKFLAIFASNLDEFFMVRVAGLKRRDETGLAVRSADGLSPREQLTRIALRNQALAEAHARVFLDHVEPELRDEGIHILRWSELSAAQRERLTDYFAAQVFPVLTPLAVDPAHPFPYISGLSLNLAVTVRDPEGRTERFARVKVPNNVPRLVRVAPDPGSRARAPCLPPRRGPHRRAPGRPVHRPGGGRGPRLPRHAQRRRRGRGGPRRGPAAEPGARAGPAPVRARRCGSRSPTR
jgi:polyphosphate kinase